MNNRLVGNNLCDESRIAFVHAPNIQYQQNYGTYFAPLWIYTLAAYVPSDWVVAIHDCALQGVEKVPRAEVFAFSGINQDLETIKAAHKRVKRDNPDAIFLIGGPITWSLQEEGKLGLLDFFDHIFILDGEITLANFLNEYRAGRGAAVPKVVLAGRFDLGAARSIDFSLITPRIKHYYGAIIEVSRGCPYLCDFCDIRVLPGNNRSAGKPIPLIISELDEYYRLGISQFQFACDNFIGDRHWAEALVDEIIAWKVRTGAHISIFTWLSIDLFRFPGLMAKMRRAGVSIVFIGIESVNHNSLLEAAKIQNTKVLREAVTTIQSFGFIIVPGFVFGFDSDTETVFADTLEFIEENGLIGGDPSFLMALPGTPLYRRMKRGGRLVNHQEWTVRSKIETNVRYLLGRDFWVRGFISFISRYCDASFQFSRFRRHMEIVVNSRNLIESDDIGYGSLYGYLQLQTGNRSHLRMLWKRVCFILGRKENLATLVRAWFLFRRLSKGRRGLAVHFRYWLYAWTNIALKYRGLSEQDFLLSSVGEGFDYSDYLRRAFADETEGLGEGEKPSPNASSGQCGKESLQRRCTERALQAVHDGGRK